MLHNFRAHVPNTCQIGKSDSFTDPSCHCFRLRKQMKYPTKKRHFMHCTSTKPQECKKDAVTEDILEIIMRITWRLATSAFSWKV